MTVHVLCRFYSHWDTLLYVGRTANPGMRTRKHAEGKAFWGEVAYISLEHYRNGDLLAAAEKKAIADEAPVYNKQHNKDRAKAVEAYRDQQQAIIELAEEDACCDWEDDDDPEGATWVIDHYAPSPPRTPEEEEEGRRCAAIIERILYGRDREAS